MDNKFQNEQSSTEDTAFKKQEKKEPKESSSAPSAGSSKDDKSKGKLKLFFKSDWQVLHLPINQWFDIKYVITRLSGSYVLLKSIFPELYV